MLSKFQCIEFLINKMYINIKNQYEVIVTTQPSKFLQVEDTGEETIIIKTNKEALLCVGNEKTVIDILT